MKNETKEWMIASELNERFGTTRQWLRDCWSEGLIHRRTITGRAFDGSLRVKYLYRVEDVIKELKKTEQSGKDY